MTLRRTCLICALTTAAAAIVPAPSCNAQDAIIIDHTCTDLSLVPDYWLEQARSLVIHYAHTSHGSQIVSGMDALQTEDPSRLAYSVVYAGSAPPASLNCAPDSLCMYDGNPPETYIEPDDYWETASGIARTEAVADTGLFGTSMWAWCGQASWYSSAQVDQYLGVMAGFEAGYPGMRFLLQTGHADPGSNIDVNNGSIRQYTIANNMVLFDFNDIESFDPDGGHHPDTTDWCDWCADWCTTHPADCAVLPADCAHAHPFNCKLKGRAFWWMMARLAGWPGPDGGEIFSDGFETGDTGAWSEVLP